MMVDTTVYGYVGDGAAYCPDCTPEDEREGMGRVYSTDDTEPEGMSCDGCGKYIFEPDFDGLWEDAILDLIRDGRARNDGEWSTARRILALFTEADFEHAGKFPDR